MYSWLSPAGDIINIDPSSREDHSVVAGFIINKLNLTVNPNEFQITTLFRHKYQRITYYGTELYCSNAIYPPTSKQMSVLKTLAIENSMTSITYDNEEDERTLWSSS